MNKRGQVTLFVIIGIVLLVSGISVFFLKDYVLKSEFERQMERSLTLPEKAAEVNTFVLSCIEDVTQEAVGLIGQQGGYIDVPKEEVPFSDANLLSNRLILSKSIEVPYWYYKKSNSLDHIQIPTLVKVQREIENYIDDNLKDRCGFEEFTGYKITSGDLKSDVEIFDDKINVAVDYPVNIEVQDFKFTLGKDEHQFYTQIDSNLGKLFDTAQTIFNSLNDDLDLETKTIDMMVLNDEVPVNGESLDCVAPIWVVEDVEKDFKRIVFENILYMKFKGTNYEVSGENKYFEIGTGVNAPDVNVNFLYSQVWPFEMDVEPNENGFLEAQSVSDGFGKVRGIIESFVCLSTWNFVYNVKYPVLVRLSKGDDTLQFAYMVVINKNEIRESSVIPESFEEFDDFVCENLQNEVSVFTNDINGKSLDDVGVSYRCINSNCDLGRSENGKFTSEFPLCVNGFVVGSKQGYHFAKQQFSSNTPGSITLELEPLVNIGVDVTVGRAGSGEVHEDEQVFISMTEVDKEYGITLVYPDQKNVKLIPGKYFVDMYMLSQFEEGFVIPKKDVRRCIEIQKGGVVGVLGGTEEKCFTVEMPSINLDQAITGRSSYTFDISASDLQEGNVRFFINYRGVPKSANDLNVKPVDVRVAVFENE